MTARVVDDDQAGRSGAIEVLRSGGVVALPTDTVYGIAVALATEGGIDRLFRAKRRPPDKAIALLLADAEQAGEIAVMTASAAALAAACWPGGLTLVLERRTGIDLPEVLTGGASTVGLRVPDHPAPRALAAAVGPLPTTSANVSGLPEGRDAAEIVALLGDSIDLVLDGGPAHGGPASTVIDCSGRVPRLLRSGAVDPSRLADALQAAGLRVDLSTD